MSPLLNISITWRCEVLYNKPATFPYPILANFSDDYRDPKFELDVDLSENTEGYLLKLEVKVSSSFLKGLLKKQKASLVLIIKDMDSRFLTVPFLEKITIPLGKDALTLVSRTTFQLMVKSEEELRFIGNEDLNEFFQPYLSRIVVPAHRILGYSNLVTFSGRRKKSYELFERRVNKHQDMEFQVSLGEETIMLSFQKEDFLLQDVPQGRNLLNPYLYIGLSRALENFIRVNGEPEGEEVNLNEMLEFKSELDEKLYNLLLEKGIDSFSLEDLDIVIHLISENMLEKFTMAVRGLRDEG